MNSKRLYYGLIALIILLLCGLIGGAYGADQMLAWQSRQLVAKRLQAAVLAGEQRQLAKARQDIKRYQSLSTIAKSIVPQDKDQAQTVRQIVSIADSNGIRLSGITFPASNLSGAAITNPTSAAKQKLSQLTPVKGIPGVYDLQLTVQSDVTAPIPYSRFIAFLDALEHNRRTALISGITIQPDTTNRSTLSFTLTLDEYIKP